MPLIIRLAMINYPHRAAGLRLGKQAAMGVQERELRSFGRRRTGSNLVPEPRAQKVPPRFLVRRKRARVAHPYKPPCACRCWPMFLQFVAYASWLRRASPVRLYVSHRLQKEPAMFEDRDIDVSHDLSSFVSELRRLADALENGDTFTVHLDGEDVTIPEGALFSVSHEREDGEVELEFQVTWSIAAAPEEDEEPEETAAKDMAE
jgi:amphi-Trp domain-containing protein